MKKTLARAIACSDDIHSTEQIEESIRATGYEFTETGHIA